MKKNLFTVCLILIISSCGLFNNSGGVGRGDTATSFCGNTICTDGKTCYTINGVAQCYASSSTCDPVCDPDTSSCVVDEDGTPTCVLNNSGSAVKGITAFSINGIAATINGLNIAITLPAGTVVATLAPTITVSPGVVSVSPASGVTQNFTNSVTYTVTKDDNTTKVYTVTVTVTPYALRDPGPAGGFIFYINPNYVTDGWKYLEVAPSDTSSNSRWSVAVGLVGTVTAIGKGQTNTNVIVSGITGESSAKLCNNLVLGSYSDWFLPSKDELHLIYTNLKAFGVGSFPGGAYWNSSEFDANNAMCENLANGYQYHGTKIIGSNMSVRCVRAFQ